MTPEDPDLAFEELLNTAFELDREALAELAPGIGASEELLEASAAGSRLMLERYAAAAIVLPDGGNGHRLWLRLRLDPAPGSRLSQVALELQWPPESVRIEELFPREIDREVTVRVESRPEGGFVIDPETSTADSTRAWGVHYRPTIRSSETGLASPWWSLTEPEEGKGLASEVLFYLALRVSGALPAPQLRLAAMLHWQELAEPIPLRIEREVPFRIRPASSAPATRRSAAVDLLWEIHRDYERGERFLVHRLSSPSVKLGLQSVRARTERMLEHAWQAWSHRLFGRIEALLRGGKDGEPLLAEEVLSAYRTAGNDLWRKLVPPEIQQGLLGLEEGRGSLLLVSDETWVPWELAVPDEKLELPYLCCRFNLARWFEQPVAPSLGMRLTRLLAFAALTVEGYPKLHPEEGWERWPARWQREIPGLSVITREQPTFSDTIERLAGGAWDWLHFDGHGKYSADDPEASSLVLTNRSLEATDVSGRILDQVRQNRPLVFLNACRTGRGGQALAGLGGWPDRWVRQGECGALVCTQWPVRNRAAGRFARAFYSRLRSGTSLGCALLETRRELLLADPTDPTPLAYTLYGHPNAGVVFGHGSPQGIEQP